MRYGEVEQIGGQIRNTRRKGRLVGVGVCGELRGGEGGGVLICIVARSEDKESPFLGWSGAWSPL